MKVKVLNKEVYELIAAGEVITRPEFVVKELVENSIDAGAKQINVHIINGGKSLIRVVYDGEGMSFSDCKLAFLRHATSKIQSEADLNFLQTLGFRGEALASICAVSEVEVLTKQKNSKILQMKQLVSILRKQNPENILLTSAKTYPHQK